IATDESRRHAATRVRELCDEVNLPSTKAKALVDEIRDGRTFYGLDGFLPAFYPSLETVFDYLPPETRVALLDPPSIASAYDEEWERASADRDARFSEGAPTFAVEDLYLPGSEIARHIGEHPMLVHDVALLQSTDHGETS